MGSVNDYKEMWQGLGLDLNNHDMLLDAVSNGYSKTFLSQKNRPQSMDYFNFVMQEVHGLRIKELVDSKKNGHKVIGSFCVFVPEEIVRATDSTLVGLCTGADFMSEKVEEILPRNLCALIKSAFGFKLGKVCPYMEVCDMIVGENTCDGKKKAYETLNNLVPHLYIIDLPQMKSEEGRNLLRSEYIKFMKAVEKLTGCPIDANNLKKGIEIDEPDETKKHFIDGRVGEIKLDGENIGSVGEIHPRILKNWKLKMPVALFEIEIDKILNLLKNNHPK